MARWTARFEPPELSRTVVEILLEALFEIDCDWLRRHPEAPDLYSSGVRYLREPIELWMSIPVVLERGGGDCEDLACWRAAELEVRRGIHARARAQQNPARAGAPISFHILVRWPDGHFEDPSRQLGM